MIKTLNLKETWRCRLDTEKKGKDKKFFLYDLDDIEMPPDSHAKDTCKTDSWVWFSSTFSVDSELYGKPAFLTLEKPRITTLWVNGTEVELNLSTIYKYNVTDYLRKGENRITLIVSNSQSDLGDIAGNVDFYEPLHIESIAVYPNIEYKNDEYAELRIKVSNMSETEKEEVIYVNGVMYEYGKPERPLNFPISSKFQFGKGDNEVTIYYPITHGNLRLWRGYSPVIYRLELKIGDDIQKVSFRMKNFKAPETDFLINGKPIFLNGLAGFAQTTIEEWIKILSIAKSYGINHYRFLPDETIIDGTEQQYLINNREIAVQFCKAKFEALSRTKKSAISDCLTFRIFKDKAQLLLKCLDQNAGSKLNNSIF